MEHERIRKSPFGRLRRLKVEADQRHARRSLGDDEFVRLIAAAEHGKVIEGVSGPDRAMLYVLAAWTGLRRRELSSLTVRSLEVNGESPTVRVEAGHAKNRQKDTIPLHGTVVERLRGWLSGRELKVGEPLFELKGPKGYFRKTAEMMRRDLASAKATWVAESDDEAE